MLTPPPSNPSADWARTDAALDELLALPASARAAAVERIAGSDAAFAQELRTLASELEAPDALLDQPAARALSPPAQDAGAAAPPSIASGSRLGAWRVLELLGRGGMGEVYRAERADGQFEQQAAIKLMRADTAPQLARFQAERQIVARLNHPGIARLLDGGVSDEGRPYMAMELVHGQHITQWCLQQAATLAHRLALFTEVCDAVAYAHRNLVVHRDIKPANVLVTDEGRVKLLDFGVARLLDTPSGEATRELLLTPAYASPEQLSGGAITTAVDVHALGLLLHELLTGQPAHAVQHLPMAAAMQQVATQDPAPPSRAAHALNAPPVPAARLAGDLDAIVAKALRKEPERRYASVDEMHADITRYVSNQPVLARNGTWAYLLARGLRRRRAWAVAGGIAALAVLGGTTATVWQARKAVLARDVAQRAAAREEALRYQLVNLFRGSVEQARNDPATAAAPVTAKTMLDRSAERLLREYRDDPELTGKLVNTLADLYGALEDVQGQVPLLGAYLAQADARADPESVALARQRLAQLELLNGHAERAGPLLGLAQSQWASDPRRYREQRLEGLNIQGQLLRARGELPAATQVFELAVAERQALGGPVQRELAVLNNSLATTLMAANQPERALAAYRQALAIYEQLGQAESVDALVVLGNTGTLAMRTGRLNEALPTLQRAFTLQRERAGDSAAVGAAMGLYGMALTAKGQSATAIGVLHQAIDIALRFTAATSPLVVQNRLFLTEALAEAGDLPAARALAQANANAARETFGPAHLFSLRTQSALARLMLRSGQVKDAQLADEALLPALRKLGPPAQGALAAALLDLGESSLAARQPLQAQTQLRQAVALREQLLWPQSWELAQARERLGEALLSSDTAAALALLKPAAETLAHELGEAHAETRRARAAQASAMRS